MSSSNHNDKLDEALTHALGAPPTADFAAWQRRHPEAIAYLNPRRINARIQRRRQMKRLMIAAATTAAALCVWLGIGDLHSTVPGIDASAFAQTAERIQKAQFITWTTTVYERITSKDGQRHWYRTNLRKFAYKAPGLYRETYLDEKGNVTGLEITDVANKKVLTLDPIKKTAIIAEVPHMRRDLQGPFLDAQWMLKDYDLQFVEKRKAADGDVNVFRKVEGHCFFDCWIDQKSKQLVEYRINQGGNTLADYENDPMRNAEPENEASGGTIVGSIDNEIDYNPSLDDSLFRLDVPEGYTLETKKRHYVTEQDVIDSFRIVADVNDGVFPVQIDQVPSELLNKCRAMPKSERSPQTQKLIEADDHYTQIGMGGLPLRQFLEDYAEWTSFRYLGKGVKLGDKNVIVCWYRLKDAKDPDTYRVVYGDLSVRDVAAKDLPLPVER